MPVFYPIIEGATDPNLQEKTATENGEVIADEGYDGLSKVTVDVPTEGGGQVELVEGAAYKTQEPDAGGVYIVLTEEMAAEAGAYTVQEIYGPVLEGLQVIIHDVDELPDVMLGLDYANLVWHMYRVMSTGVVYQSTDGTPATAESLGASMFGSAEADKGWVDGINGIEPTAENAGVYSVRGGLVDKYYTFTGGEFVLTSDTPDTAVTVDDANTYTYGDNVYLHDADGWHLFVVPTPIKLQEKTTTKNGEVTADEGYDGLAKVTVDVPTGGGGSITANMTAKAGLAWYMNAIVNAKTIIASMIKEG